MPTTTKPKPDVVLMAAGMRTVAKPLAGLAELFEGVHVTGMVSMTVPEPALARVAATALGDVAERLRISGPYEPSGNIHLTYEFAVDRYDIPRLEVTVNIPPQVADEIAPNWRAVAAAGEPEWCQVHQVPALECVELVEDHRLAAEADRFEPGGVL